MGEASHTTTADDRAQNGEYQASHCYAPTAANVRRVAFTVARGCKCQGCLILITTSNRASQPSHSASLSAGAEMVTLENVDLEMRVERKVEPKVEWRMKPKVEITAVMADIPT